MHLNNRCIVVSVFMIQAAVVFLWKWELTKLSPAIFFSSPIDLQVSSRATFHRSRETLALLDQRIEMLRESLNSTYSRQVEEHSHILIVTSWRPGSTFLGRVFSHHPDVFFNYEPLWHMGIKQVRSGEEAETAVQDLKDFNNCRYVNQEYLKMISAWGYVSYNVNIWKTCEKGSNVTVCNQAAFLSAACHKFPVVVSKVVRLRLNLTRPLLEDKSFDRLKVVYLVRDPRATLQSRRMFQWCREAPDCIEPKRLCDDLLDDVNAFEQLSRLFPGRIQLVRYEDLAMKPQEMFAQLFDFAGLHMTPQIKEFVYNETGNDASNVNNEALKSAERIDRWKSIINRTDLDAIQHKCSPILLRMNYSLI